jgi:molybdenum cofactor guanylyltransferase
MLASKTMTAGILLAGGRSQRMGQDKALLPLPGSETFLGRLVALLAPTCPELLLVARDEAQAATYRDHIPGNVQLVTDHLPDIGPLMGLYSGLRAMQSSHALVIAIDMPYLQPAMRDFLLAQPHDDALTVPIVDGAPQVLLALYPRSILPIIENQLREGQRGPRALLRLAPVRYIPEEQLRAIDPQLRSFININRPEDRRM